LPILVVLDFVLNNKRKTTKKKLSSDKTVQNWTPCRRRMREACDFLNTSSGHAHNIVKVPVSTDNQPNLESTQNQPSFLRPKFWALSPKL
jgi:hypothetical protein